MKRMITTAGLTALGAASLAPGFAQEVSQKPWAVGATIKGFYDDNIYTYSKKLQNTIPNFQADSWGFSVAPDATYNLKTDQTALGLSYIYTMTYFVDRPRPRDDQSHQANAKLSHSFSERNRIDVSDSFASAQEPSILDPSVGIATPIRTPGTNNRNSGRINFESDFTEQLGVDLGYNNTVYDYEEDSTTAPVGSRSAVLDRMEHEIYFDGNYLVAPKTKLTLGYRYGVIDYTSQDLFVPGVRGTERDSNSHFVSVGVRQDLNAQLVLSGKVGVQITEYQNKQLFGGDKTSPYAEASARWQYAEGSSAQLNIKHQRIATDVRADQVGQLVADAEITSVMLSVSHALTSKIRIDGSAMYQHSEFNSGGGGGSPADELFFGSLMVTYQFNPFIAVEGGYMFDRLDSDLLGGFRSYTRNRVFIGTRLTY